VVSRSLQNHEAILWDRSLASHTRAVEILDRQSREARMPC
jgi:hypothetical protein